MAAEYEDVLQLEALLIARAYLYTLFHKLFGGEPSAELLSILEGEITRDVVEEYAENPTMAGLVMFSRELAARDQAQLLDVAHDEYTRIFVGPAVLPASPYQSPYITNDPSTFQENTLVVRAEYAAEGLRVKKFQRVPEDQVAVLMYFSAMRCVAVLDAFREGNWAEAAATLRKQNNFTRSHLADWLPDYALALRKQKDPVLYPQLMEAAAAFVQADATFADEAAYYLEQTTPTSRSVESPFTQVDEALATLTALRLRFLEDCELETLQ